MQHAPRRCVCEVEREVLQNRGATLLFSVFSSYYYAASFPIFLFFFHRNRLVSVLASIGDWGGDIGIEFAPISKK